MKNDFLIEIGVEELPASYIKQATLSFKNEMENLFTKNNLEFNKIEKFYTPRRLVLLTKSLDVKQEDTQKIIIGPPRNVCFDSNGNKTKAYTSFINRNNIDENEIHWEEKNGSDYLAVDKKIIGKKSSNIIKNNLKEIISNIKFPKKMKWNQTGFLFARPIRWLLVFFGDKTLDIEIAGIKSSNKTYLLRKTTNNKCSIKNIEDYFSKIEQSGIEINFNKRKSIIKEDIIKIMNTKNGDSFYSEDLINEVANLVESPNILAGTFNKKYLELPSEVISAAMSQHQRYFSLYKKEEILPNFIFVANGHYKNNLKIVEGNQRVLNGRLDDALFYWKEDNKNSLKDFNNKLKNVIWIDKLGTLWDKVQRIVETAKYLDIGKEGIKMSQYLKIDLVSEMIKDGKEFTKLQGTIAKYYLLKKNISSKIARGVEQHYWPKKWGHKLPKIKEAKYLSIIDKLDDIIGAFITGTIPSGSKDPYGLKRKMNNIIAIILGYENNKIDQKEQVKINLFSLIDYIYQLYGQNKNKDLMIDFVWERISSQFKELGLPYDITEAVVETKTKDLKKLYSRAQAFKKLSHSEDFKKVADTFKRVVNIVEKAEEKYEKKFDKKVEKSLLKEKEELNLYKKWKEYSNQLKSIEGNYEEFFNCILKLKPYVDDFFDNVMVMSKNSDLRINRLSLLSSIANYFTDIIKFKFIVVN